VHCTNFFYKIYCKKYYSNLLLYKNYLSNFNNNLFCRSVKMIPIIVYFGGDTISNAHTGVEYSIDLRLTVSKNKNLIFEKIIRTIYQ
jgi:hypothetical protein